MGRINESMKQLETAMEELERQLGVERKREEQESHREGVQGGQGVLAQGS